VTITGGSAADFGGGIANIDGAVALNHSQVTGNTAVVAGGGIAAVTGNVVDNCEPTGTIAGCTA